MVITSLTTGLPSVIVPVLSNNTVLILCANSKCSPSLIRIPFSAPLPIPTISAVGVAKPIAHGQAIMSTATKLISAIVNASSPPIVSQTIKVIIEITITMGTNTAATLSANFCIGAFEP